MNYGKPKRIWDNSAIAKKILKKFINGELGSNLIFKYKSRSLTTDLNNLAKIALFSTLTILEKNNIKDKNTIDFINDLFSYKICQTSDIFNLEQEKEGSFIFDINKFLSDKDTSDLKNSIVKFKYKSPKKLFFKLDDVQLNEIENYNSLFGRSVEGISRTL